MEGWRQQEQGRNMSLCSGDYRQQQAQQSSQNNQQQQQQYAQLAQQQQQQQQSQQYQQYPQHKQFQQSQHYQQSHSSRQPQQQRQTQQQLHHAQQQQQAHRSQQLHQPVNQLQQPQQSPATSQTAYPAVNSYPHPYQYQPPQSQSGCQQEQWSASLSHQATDTRANGPFAALMSRPTVVPRLSTAAAASHQRPESLQAHLLALHNASTASADTSQPRNRRPQYSPPSSSVARASPQPATTQYASARPQAHARVVQTSQTLTQQRQSLPSPVHPSGRESYLPSPSSTAPVQQTRPPRRTSTSSNVSVSGIAPHPVHPPLPQTSPTLPAPSTASPLAFAQLGGNQSPTTQAGRSQMGPVSQAARPPSANRALEQARDSPQGSGRISPVTAQNVQNANAMWSQQQNQTQPVAGRSTLTANEAAQTLQATQAPRASQATQAPRASQPLPPTHVPRAPPATQASRAPQPPHAGPTTQAPRASHLSQPQMSDPRIGNRGTSTPEVAANKPPPKKEWTWPQGAREQCGQRAVEWLLAQPANAGKTITAREVIDMLARNPPYHELCQAIERRGFALDAVAFAAHLRTSLASFSRGTGSPRPSPQTQVSPQQQPQQQQPQPHQQQQQQTPQQQPQPQQQPPPPPRPQQQHQQQPPPPPQQQQQQQQHRPMPHQLQHSPNQDRIPQAAIASPLYAIPGGAPDPKVHSRPQTQPQRQSLPHPNYMKAWAPIVKRRLALTIANHVNFRNRAQGRRLPPEVAVNMLDSDLSLESMHHQLESMGFVVELDAFARMLLTAVHQAQQDQAGVTFSAAQPVQTIIPNMMRSAQVTIDLTSDSPEPQDMGRPEGAERAPAQNAAPTSRSHQFDASGTVGNGVVDQNDHGQNDKGKEKEVPKPMHKAVTSLMPQTAASTGVKRGRKPKKNSFGSGPELVDPIDETKIAKKTKYNTDTIARDVLIAAGRHPTLRGLNHHLEGLKPLLKARSPNVKDDRFDLSTLKWDLIDPTKPVDADGDVVMGEQGVSKTPDGQPVVKPKRKYTKRASSSSSGRVEISIPVISNGTPERVVSSGRKSVDPHQSPYRMIAVNADEFGIEDHEPATAPDYRRKVQVSDAPVDFVSFNCGWIKCKASLHSMAALEKHLDTVHCKDGKCSWKRCRHEFATREECMEHLMTYHVYKMAGNLGEGQRVLPRGIVPFTTAAQDADAMDLDSSGPSHGKTVRATDDGPGKRLTAAQARAREERLNKELVKEPKTVREPVPFMELGKRHSVVDAMGVPKTSMLDMGTVMSRDEW